MSDPVTATIVDQAFALFESRTNLERGGTPHLRQYRLERMDQILRRLDSPHETLPAIHLAGSKGKGSTAAFTAHILAATGLRVGLYTSPHVTGYRERFQVLRGAAAAAHAPPAGDPAPGADRPGLREEEEEEEEMLLARESRLVWSVVEAMSREGTPEEELPTTFELLTALAFRFFAATRCDVVVLETGLGGRLDATNLCRPLITMITRIELEHQEYLGETLQEIAREKGGIIKPGVPVVIAPQRREVRQVLQRIARDRQAPLVTMRPLSRSAGLTPGMAGAVQLVNAGQALAAVRELFRRGLIPGARLEGAPSRQVLSPELLSRALAGARLPGRGERVQDVLLDGAHTPESVAQAVRMLRGRKCITILGVVGGKDLPGIAAALRGRVERVIVSRPGTFKPGDPRAVYEAVLAAGIPAELHLEPVDALARARELNSPHGAPRRAGPILVTGSFYMVGEIRRLLGEIPCP